ncbi:MAG: hypothetical protein J6P03_02890 [Opitutales bacterium]|nr:hypothetical protein [Opitutales bacterium]
MCDKKIEISAKLALFEGDINARIGKSKEFLFPPSNVNWVDFNTETNDFYDYPPSGQTSYDWSAYAKSQISDIGTVRLTGVKTINDLEQKYKLNPLDKSESFSVSYDLEKNQRGFSSNLGPKIKSKNHEKENH